MGKVILYLGLYITLLSMSSTYLVDFGKKIINSTGISSLTKKVNKIERRSLSAADFKLISSSPQSKALMDKLANSVISLQYNDVITAKLLAEKKRMEGIRKRELAQIKLPKPPTAVRRVRTLNLQVDAAMDSGAIINGRYYKNGDRLFGSGKVVLNGFNRTGSMIRLSVNDENYQFSIKDGVVNESIAFKQEIAFEY